MSVWAKVSSILVFTVDSARNPKPYSKPQVAKAKKPQPHTLTPRFQVRSLGFPQTRSSCSVFVPCPAPVLKSLGFGDLRFGAHGCG